VVGRQFNLVAAVPRLYEVGPTSVLSHHATYKTHTHTHTYGTCTLTHIYIPPHGHPQGLRICTLTPPHTTRTTNAPLYTFRDLSSCVFYTRHAHNSHPSSFSLQPLSLTLLLAFLHTRLAFHSSLMGHPWLRVCHAAAARPLGQCLSGSQSQQRDSVGGPSSGHRLPHFAHLFSSLPAASPFPSQLCQLVLRFGRRQDQGVQD